MATFIIMPKLGLTMESGVVTKWLKHEGDEVKKGEAVFELETDKLDTTAEAPVDGILRKILIVEGTEVPILTEMGILAGKDEDISAMTAGKESAAAAAAPAEEPAAGAAREEHKPQARTDGRIVATPRAKAVAKELGVDLAQVTPSGPNGRIVEKDVRNYRPAPAQKASPLAAKAAKDLQIDLGQIKKDGRVMAEDLLAYLEGSRAPAAGGEAVREERKPMKGMRKAIAQNMLNSHMTSPTVTYDASVDMSAMKQYRAQLAAGGLKVSYTDLLVKFVAKALTEFPLVNCSVEGNEIIFKHYVNMGVAVALEDGLVVPNIPDADKKGLAEISRELKELSEAARNGTLSMDKMRGGTFTITNLGMFGIESFSPIINQPEVAILGVNAMEDRLVIRNGEQVIRPFIRLSLTADHRVVDGAVAARFLQRVKMLLENPALMLA